MMRKAALTVLLALGSAGCVAGPPPQIDTPSPVLPASFTYLPDAVEAGSLAALLPHDDAGFVALRDVALADAPSLGEATARIERARAAARRARAERAPQLDLSASVETSRTNPGSLGASLPPGITIDPDRTSYGAALGARWEADLFGRLRAEQRAAAARLDAATADADAVRVALIADIASQVVDWRSLEARQAALSRDLDAADNLARLAASRAKAGLAPGIDAARAEAIAASSRSRLAALDGERANLVDRLVTLTARDAAWIVEQLAVGPAAKPLPAAPAALPSDLLTRRPDVAAAAARLAAADGDLAAAAARRFPRLSLSGTLGLLAFSPGQLFDDESLIGSLAAAIAAPLLDFGRISAEIDAAAADKKIAFQQYRAAVFDALGDAESGYRLVAASDARAVATTDEAARLARVEALTATRVRAGLDDLSAQLEARRQSDGATERAAIARGKARRARLLLWLALGGS